LPTCKIKDSHIFLPLYLNNTSVLILKDKVMNRNILVCDDEPLVMDLIEGYFEEKGYHVWKSLNGADIRKKIRESDPSVIIMDLNMLIFEGDELTRLLKNSIRTKDIPIVIYSSSPDARQRAVESGADGFIPKKGSTMTDLEKTVEKLIEEKSMV
jgi:two-component system, cell cycle response regulator DivK